MFVKSYSPERQKHYVDFPNEDQLENQTGILSVDSIEIYQAKQLPSEHILQIEPYFSEIDNSLYDDIQYYYIGFNYSVIEESEFFYNGVRYEVLAVGVLDGTEYIIGHENVYDYSVLETFGYTFNTEAEKKAENIVKQRENGLIVNFNNEILYDQRINKEYVEMEVQATQQSEEISIIQNIDKVVEDNPIDNKNLEKASKGNDNIGIQPFSSTSTPSTFKLYITSTKKIVNIGFDAYTKDLLPNEWYASWEEEALKAGAIAIKTYAWYNATYPRKPATDYNAHLTDKWQNYQHYVPNSGTTETDTAVDDVSGIFMRNSDGKVFDAQYRAGTKGEIGESFGGVVSQWGTQFIALNYPQYNYYTILSYYYSYSDKSSDLIETGNY